MKKFLAITFILLFVCYLFFLLRPALQNQLTGTFINHTIPDSYQGLAQKLAADKTFYRTFWIPTVPTYSYYSFSHPQISGEDWLQVTNTKSVLQFIQQSRAQEILQEMSVKYVIVPLDSEGKIFLADRKYDNAQYISTINSLTKISWLHRTLSFGKLAVFQISNPKDHFWLQNAYGSLTYGRVNPTRYDISLHTIQKGERLIFAETFDPHWILQIKDKKLIASEYHHMNSFLLPADGSYRVMVYYQSQEWVLYGTIISIVSFAILIALLVYLYFFNKKNEK